MRTLAKLSAEKGYYYNSTFGYIAINQLIGQEHKLVGVVAAKVEAVSLQRKTVSQSSPTAKANRSNLSSSFGLGCQLQAGDM